MSRSWHTTPLARQGYAVRPAAPTCPSIARFGTEKDLADPGRWRT